MTHYFAQLGLKPSFALDDSVLRKAYIDVQQRCHPDRMVGKSDAERMEAIQQSMDANEAYEALKSPLTRAQHLLELQGILVNSEEGDTVKPEPTLLMEIMELREQLAAARTEADIAHAAHDLRHAMQACVTSLASAFDDADWQRAAGLTIRLRYLGKSLEEATIRQYQIQQMKAG